MYHIVTDRKNATDILKSENAVYRKQERRLYMNNKNINDQKESSPKMVKGSIYPEFRGRDRIKVDVNDGRISVYVAFRNPSDEKVQQFSDGKPFLCRFLVMREIIFFLFKFGTLEWVDAPYSVHLGRTLFRLKRPKDNEGYPIFVYFFDAATGQLMNLNRDNLDHDQSVRLYEMIKEQCQTDFDIRDYAVNLICTYNSFSTEALVFYNLLES